MSVEIEEKTAAAPDSVAPSGAAARAARLRAVGRGKGRLLAAAARRARRRSRSPRRCAAARSRARREITEVEVARHFTRLSRLNFSIDQGLYPLGSCTMKHNPRTNEEMARLPGFAAAHPLAPEARVPGRAGARLAARAHPRGADRPRRASRCSPRPERRASSPGSSWCGKRPREGGPRADDRPHPRLGARHQSGLGALRRLQGQGAQVQRPRHDRSRRPRGGDDRGRRGADADGAEHARRLRGPHPRHRPIVHAKGGLPLLRRRELQRLRRHREARADGRRRHAHEPPQDLLDAARRGRAGLGPGGGRRERSCRSCRARRSSGARTERSSSTSTGRTRSAGCGRSSATSECSCARSSYIAAYGNRIGEVARGAVLNANYIRAGLSDVYHLKYDAPSMHEVVFSDKKQVELGVSNMDIAKRLMDYGFHPPTVSFPLIVHGALMIEPTETEGKPGLDAFIQRDARDRPRVRRGARASSTAAPHTTPVRRVDEVGAAQASSSCAGGRRTRKQSAVSRSTSAAGLVADCLPLTAYSPDILPPGPI